MAIWYVTQLFIRFSEFSEFVLNCFVWENEIKIFFPEHCRHPDIAEERHWLPILSHARTSKSSWFKRNSWGKAKLKTSHGNILMKYFDIGRKYNWPKSQIPQCTCSIKDLSMMYRALWDRRHEGATRISQCTRRVAPSPLTNPSGPWVPPISQCTIHHA